MSNADAVVCKFYQLTPLTSCAIVGVIAWQCRGGDAVLGYGALLRYTVGDPLSEHLPALPVAPMHAVALPACMFCLHPAMLSAPVPCCVRGRPTRPFMLAFPRRSLRGTGTAVCPPSTSRWPATYAYWPWTGRASSVGKSSGTTRAARIPYAPLPPFPPCPHEHNSSHLHHADLDAIPGRVVAKGFRGLPLIPPPPPSSPSAAVASARTACRWRSLWCGYCWTRVWKAITDLPYPERCVLPPVHCPLGDVGAQARPALSCPALTTGLYSDTP